MRRLETREHGDTLVIRVSRRGHASLPSAESVVRGLGPPVWNHFQYSCPVIVRAYAWAGSDDCGLGRGLLYRAANIIAARARSESLLRYSDVTDHMHTNHAPLPETNGERNYLGDSESDRHG